MLAYWRLVHRVTKKKTKANVVAETACVVIHGLELHMCRVGTSAAYMTTGGTFLNKCCILTLTIIFSVCMKHTTVSEDLWMGNQTVQRYKPIQISLLSCI